MLTSVFLGSVALLAGGGGSFLTTRSHYTKKIRALEARLAELRRALRERDEELEAARTELIELRERLITRERRLEVLGRSIHALRDMTTELDHRLAEHEGFSKKLMALLTARMSDHRDQSERMRERLDHARESLGDIGTEEVSLKAEVVELQRDLTSTEETIRVRQQDRAQTDSEIQATEEEMKSVIGV